MQTLLQRPSRIGEGGRPVNIDELCAEVNRVLAERGVSVADGRTSSVVTPRNVRYYCSLGLVKPPVREGKRARYETSHVDEVVSVKQAQENGATLEQILKVRQAFAASLTERRDVSGQPWLASVNRMAVEPMMNPTLFSATFSRSVSPSSINPDIVVSTRRPAGIGWSVRLGEMTLSGPGEPPTPQQIAAVMNVLGDEHPD